MITEEQQLLSIPDNNYLSDYNITRKVVDNAVNSFYAYWELIRRCQNHIRGEKPVLYQKLKEKGLAWVSNENFGKAKAKIEKNVASNVNRVSQALSLGYVTFRSFKEEDRKGVLAFLEDEGQRGIVAASIGYAFVDMLLKEHRLSNLLNEIEYASYAFGFCAMISEGEDDWMYDPIHPLDIAFRPKSKPNQIPQWVIFKTVPALELYKKYVKAKNEQTLGKDQISSSGWSVKGLEAVLYRAFRGKINKGGEMVTPECWADVLPSFAICPQEIIENTEDVTLAKVFHVELDGSISVVYIPYSSDRDLKHDAKKLYTSSNQTDANVVSERLFYKNFKCSQEEKLILIRDSGFSETSYIEDYRGIAQLAVRDSIRYNKTRNDMNDKLRLIGMPMFEKPTATSMENFKIIVGQGFSMVPAGFLLEKQPSFDIGSHITAVRFEENEYIRETEHYDASLQGRLSSRPNRDEVQAQSREVNALNTSKDYVKYGDYSALFFQVLKRLQRLRLDRGEVGHSGWRRFFDSCKKLLPFLETDEDVKEVLDAIDSYRMEPVLNDVSAITIAIQMAETPFARNRFKRMLLLANGMPIEEININTPLITDKMVNFNDARIAAFENEDFWTSRDVIVQGTDDQILHLDSHIGRCERMIQGYQQGSISPVDAFKYLENAIVHIIQHIDLLGRDPVLNGRAQEYIARVNEIVKAKNHMQLAAQRMLEAQARASEQQQIDPETQANIERKNAEAMAKQQRTDFLTQSRTQQAYQRIDADREIGLARVEAEKEVRLAQQNNEPTNPIIP